MASVPNNFTFSLRDVVNVVGLSTNGSSLSDCYDAADSGGFSIYKQVGVDNLRGFRAYEHPELFSVFPMFLQIFPPTGRTDTLTVTSSSSWTATRSATWFTVTPLSGYGGVTSVTLSVPRNFDSARTGSITFTSYGTDIIISFAQDGGLIEF